MVKPLLLIFALPTISHICYGLKILTVFHTVSKSHNILGDGINMVLLNAGHEVTYITPFLKKDPHPNLRQINVTSNFDLIPKDRLKMSTLQSQVFTHEIIMLGMHFCSTVTVENENVQRLLKDPNEHFDLVIVDWMYNEIFFGGWYVINGFEPGLRDALWPDLLQGSDGRPVLRSGRICVVVLAKIFDAPLIWVSTLEPHWSLMTHIDEAFHPAYTNDFLSDNSPPFTFWQRVKELWTQIKVTFYKETILYFFDARAYNNLIAPLIKARGMEPPSPQELRGTASLVIGNSHVSFGEAYRLPVNYIAAAGFHIEENVKPLPEDLKKIMDNAKDGVIYFSMGSMILSKDLPDEVKKSLITMFGTLKQTVLWKFEEQLPDLPKNVHILKWAPQQSILAHPNCVLFITHGGLLSTFEAIHNSVPIIGIPVFADQFSNINKAISKGIAKKIDLVSSPTVVEDLKSAIEEILWDPSYKEKMEELSFIFHHRPAKPAAEVVHWLEHVVKTRGAPHMRSPALIVPWYQKYYLDLFALIVLVAVAIIFLYKNVLRGILFKKTADKMKTN